MALKDNLVSYWKLDEASGTRVDSHSTNDLTDNNTVGSATGKIGNCASFVRANSEYLNCADNAGLSAGDVDFEVGCWVRLDSKPGAMPIALKGNTGGFEWYLAYDSGVDRFSVSMYTAGFADPQTCEGMSHGSPSTGVWYRVHAWHDSVNNLVGIWVNGVSDTESRTAGVADTSGDFVLGNSLFGSYFDGQIDEVAFWKRVLTSDERTEIYNSGNGLGYDDWDVAAGQPTVKRWGGIEYSPFAVGMSGIKRW